MKHVETTKKDELQTMSCDVICCRFCFFRRHRPFFCLFFFSLFFQNIQRNVSFAQERYVNHYSTLFVKVSYILTIQYTFLRDLAIFPGDNNTSSVAFNHLDLSCGIIRAITEPLYQMNQSTRSASVNFAIERSNEPSCLLSAFSSQIFVNAEPRQYALQT